MKKLVSVILCFALVFLSVSLVGCNKTDKKTVEESSEKDGLKFGMNIHNSAYQSYPADDLEKNILACKDLGMDIVRYNQGSYTEEAIADIKRVSELCHKNGMKLMLVVDSTDQYNLPLTSEEIEEIEQALFYNFSSALGDAVDIYQIFNEIDVHCIFGNENSKFVSKPDGEKYDIEMWNCAFAAVKGALKGIEEGNPEAKTCINFAWWHTAFIYELYEDGVRWDITGLDWYEDNETASSVEELMKDVEAHIPETEFMICETNYWMNLKDVYTEEQNNALKDAKTRDANQAKWVPEFVDKLIEINNPKLKAVIFYELMDEPAIEERDGIYNGEAHFGFIECDKDGQNRKEKPVYNKLKEKIAEIKAK